MQGDIDRILIPRQHIAQRVREMAQQITADFSAERDSFEITIVPILTGAMIFCADLIREIPISLRIGMITVSSYPGRSVASQGAEVLSRQLEDVRGRRVLLVDDILDTGNTLGLVVPLLKEMGAASVRSCVLLRKDNPAALAFHADYVGFDIPNEFVVGYGLDFNNHYRNLPEIVTLKQHVLEARP
jgi:hypoxanthine phosphoribosyltransferase